MKHILLIDKNQYGYNISDSQYNKCWILQYDSTLDQIIQYCGGWLDCANRTQQVYEYSLYFTNKVDGLNSEQKLNVVSEAFFQQKRVG